MTDDDPEEPVATPAQLMARTKAAHAQLEAARITMVADKNLAGAQLFCRQWAALRGARAALPPLRLVSQR